MTNEHIDQLVNLLEAQSMPIDDRSKAQLIGIKIAQFVLAKELRSLDE